MRQTRSNKESPIFQQLLDRLADEHFRELAEARSEFSTKRRSHQGTLREENPDLRRRQSAHPDLDDAFSAPEEDGGKVQSLVPYRKVLNPGNVLLTSPADSPRVDDLDTMASSQVASTTLASATPDDKKHISAAVPEKPLDMKDSEGSCSEEVVGLAFVDADMTATFSDDAGANEPIPIATKNTTISSEVVFDEQRRDSEHGTIESMDATSFVTEATERKSLFETGEQVVWAVKEIWLIEDFKSGDLALKRKVAKSTQVKEQKTIDSEKLSAGGSAGNQRVKGCGRCSVCMEPFIASPSNPFRLVWDLMGMILISYDVVMIPMGLFEPPETPFLVFMNHLTMFFWTGDIIASFFVGFVSRGATIMDPVAIAVRYAKTWMIPDLIVVIADWAHWIAGLGSDDSEDNVGGVGRFLRVLRTVRTLRLVRLLKLKRIMNVIEDHIESEYMAIVGEILKLLVCMLGLGHVVACTFYFVGTNGEDGKNWITANNVNGTSWEYRYTTSLHWSLTQLMLESMDISARSHEERVFTIFILVFGLIVFSSVVSRVTSSMIQLQNMHDNTSKQFWLLRRYFRERNVPKTLAARIQRYLEYSIQQRQQHVQESNVRILSLLSNQLHDELQYAISVPHLGNHPFFAHISKVSDVVMYRLSAAAISRRSLACDDSLFFQGEVASSMFFVVAGELTYVKEAFDDIVSVVQEDWICEPALWTVWNHLGDMHAATECDLIVLTAQIFGEVMRSNPLIWQLASTYAKAFVQKLNNTPQEDMIDVARFVHEVSSRKSVRNFNLNISGSMELVTKGTASRNSIIGWKNSAQRTSADANEALGIDNAPSTADNINGMLNSVQVPTMAFTKLARAPVRQQY